MGFVVASWQFRSSGEASQISGNPARGGANACKKNHQEKKSKSTEAMRKGKGRREENSLWE
jgi:hypothetical protein